MKKLSKVFLVLIAFVAGKANLYSQVALPCKDEFMANPFYLCGADFRPVCACDNVTYHNECAAFQHGGIQGNQWVSGPCQEFYYYLYPVPAYGTLTLKMQFESRGGNATVLIMNIYGQIAYQQTLSAGNDFPLTAQFDMQRLEPGFYVVTVYSNKYRQTQMFSVINP